MPTLSETLERHAAEAPVERSPQLPVRMPGGAVVQPSPASTLVPAQAVAGLAQVRVLGGGGRRVPVPPPRFVPGGIPVPQKAPAIPEPPRPPEPRAGQSMDARRAPRVVSVPLNAFADTWKAKPQAPLEIGLRLISDHDLDNARAYASRIAREHHPDPSDEDGRIEAYNELLMQWAVAVATCKPSDASKAYWQAPHDEVGIAFTEDGLKLMFHELIVLKIEHSPLIAEADATAIESLGKMLSIPGIAAFLVERGEPRLRRHITWVFDQVKKLIGAAPGAPTGPESDDVDPDEIPRGEIR